MDNKEYLKSMILYVKEVNKEFYDLQKIIWKGLLEFHNICMRNGIQYQLAYGTLLGFIRDGGQVPWDYDIDTFVSYKDRDRLVKSLNQELSDDFFLDCYENNHMCESYKLRITPRGMDPKLVHVDIFLLIPAPSDIKKRKSLGRKLVLLSKMRKYKTDNIGIKGINKSRALKIKCFLFKMLYRPIPLFVVDRIYESIVRKTTHVTSSFYMRSDRRALVYNEYPKSFIEDVILYQNESASLMVSKEYHEMLKLEFGDYNKYPSMRDRFDEWYKSCIKLQLTIKPCIEYHTLVKDV